MVGVLAAVLVLVVVGQQLGWWGSVHRRAQPAYLWPIARLHWGPPAHPRLEYNIVMFSAEIAPETETATKQVWVPTEGPLYQVIIHNDDVTPMDFVLHILLSFFRLDGPHAIQVMYTAHYHGSAYVQTLPKPEPEKRTGLAHMSARLRGYPLRFSLKPETKR